VAAISGRLRAGGILGRDLISFVGSAALYGFDPTRVVRASPLELELYVVAVNAAAEHQQQRDLNLARTIVNELSRALKRK
jgi:hypothetical protein